MRTTELMEGDNTAGKEQFLSFQLGAEEYGIDILRVQEIRATKGQPGSRTRPRTSRA